MFLPYGHFAHTGRPCALYSTPDMVSLPYLLLFSCGLEPLSPRTFLVRPLSGPFLALRTRTGGCHLMMRVRSASPTSSDRPYGPSLLMTLGRRQPRVAVRTHMVVAPTVTLFICAPMACSVRPLDDDKHGPQRVPVMSFVALTVTQRSLWPAPPWHARFDLWTMTNAGRSAFPRCRLSS